MTWERFLYCHLPSKLKFPHPFLYNDKEDICFCSFLQGLEYSSQWFLTCTRRRGQGIDTFQWERSYALPWNSEALSRMRSVSISKRGQRWLSAMASFPFYPSMFLWLMHLDSNQVNFPDLLAGHHCKLSFNLLRSLGKSCFSLVCMFWNGLQAC